MKKRQATYFAIGGLLLTAFAAWTAAISFVDVRPIGSQGSMVGLSAFNSWFHTVTGVHFSLYRITDWLSLIPVIFALGFAFLGLVQWIRRGSVRKVDKSILALGGFYVAVFGIYLLFEVVIMNYRPVLIEGVLEASYPSSTTVLVLSVMLTGLMQLRQRMKASRIRKIVLAAIYTYTVFMILGRLISGVHWITDIIGGVLLSCGLVVVYYAVCITLEVKK